MDIYPQIHKDSEGCPHPHQAGLISSSVSLTELSSGSQKLWSASFHESHLLRLRCNVLIHTKEEGWIGFSKASHEGLPSQGISWGAIGPVGIPRKGRPEGLAEENPMHPDSFVWIDILLKTGQIRLEFKMVSASSSWGKKTSSAPSSWSKKTSPAPSSSRGNGISQNP